MEELIKVIDLVNGSYITDRAVQIEDYLVVGLSLRFVYCEGISQFEWELVCSLYERLFACNLMVG